MLDISWFYWLIISGIVFLILGPEESAKLFRKLMDLKKNILGFWSDITKPQEHNNSELPLAPKVHLALFQPEIPHNTGALLRLSACLGVPLHIIEPCSFIWSNRYLQRSGMDYIQHALHWKHQDWESFRTATKGQRVILLTGDAPVSYRNFNFQPHDILLCGQESVGVPEDIAKACDAKVSIPMRPPCRSLNVTLAATLVVGEALSQLEERP